MVIISADGDYECRLQEGRLKEALSSEFSEATKRKCTLAKSIKVFLDRIAQHAQTSRMIQRRECAQALSDSGSFAQTHGAIARLVVYDDFNEDDLRLIIGAYDENDQVGGIAGDHDVCEFYKRLRNAVSKLSSLVPLYEKVYKECEYGEEQELPEWLK